MEVQLNYTPEEVLLELKRRIDGDDTPFSAEVLQDLQTMVRLVGKCVRRVD